MNCLCSCRFRSWKKYIRDRYYYTSGIGWWFCIQNTAKLPLFTSCNKKLIKPKFFGRLFLTPWIIT